MPEPEDTATEESLSQALAKTLARAAADAGAGAASRARHPRVLVEEEEICQLGQHRNKPDPPRPNQRRRERGSVGRGISSRGGSRASRDSAGELGVGVRPYGGDLPPPPPARLLGAWEGGNQGMHLPPLVHRGYVYGRRKAGY